ncbi:MAG: hypothetical protein QOK05_2323 [Chloroflexota bacterium]|jgi:NADH dehydrogenase|nr:hypothetical protein [Chloroflexota bacterium]
MRIAITGGTGFVGGHLAASLMAQGHEVVIVARGVDDRPWARLVRQLPGITTVDIGLGDEAALTAAFSGCLAVAHCAGINREIGDATYEAVHVRGTEHVVRAAEHAGVSRLVLISFLRARPQSGSPYHESKWRAEEIVRASSLAWTIVKPGVMYGRGDHMLDHMSRALLTFPVYLGVGERRARPVAVADVVRVLEAALVAGRLSHATVGLTGPTDLAFDDAARLVARVLGKRRAFIKAPLLVHRLLAVVAERVMKVPLISTAQVRMLREELVEAAWAPDEVPEDLVPPTQFDENAVRAGLPHLERFGLRDLRRISRPTGEVVVAGIGTTIMKREPEAIMEFVLDVERYRNADRKIGKVHAFQRVGNVGEVRHDGRVLGLRAPAVTLAFHLTPNSRLDFVGVAMPWPMRAFDGYFTCEPAEGGTKVVHREAFTLSPIVGRVLGPVMGAWLSRDTPAEVLRIKRILESDALAQTAE